jgi:hypothetical protein
MKVIALLFAILIVSAMGGIVPIKKNSGRTSTPETVDFQLIYLGSCEQFQSISPISVSSLNGGCLPASPSLTSFTANDDLTADVLRTNIGKDRCQIDFVEIFISTESSPYVGGFAISFTPNAPFKAVGGATYVRRPSCTTQKDFCSTTNYVQTCTDNFAQLQNGYVVSNDYIFIIPNQQSAVGCATGVNACCQYVNSTYCPYTAPTGTLSFNWEKLHQDQDDDDDHEDHHEEHHEEHHDDHHNDHHDNHHDNHHNDHHDNHHEDHHIDSDGDFDDDKRKK